MWFSFVVFNYKTGTKTHPTNFAVMWFAPFQLWGCWICVCLVRKIGKSEAPFLFLLHCLSLLLFFNHFYLIWFCFPQKFSFRQSLDKKPQVSVPMPVWLWATIYLQIFSHSHCCAFLTYDLSPSYFSLEWWPFSTIRLCASSSWISNKFSALLFGLDKITRFCPHWGSVDQQRLKERKKCLPLWLTK